MGYDWSAGYCVVVDEPGPPVSHGLNVYDAGSVTLDPATPSVGSETPIGPGSATSMGTLVLAVDVAGAPYSCGGLRVAGPANAVVVVSDSSKVQTVKRSQTFLINRKSEFPFWNTPS